MGKKTIWALCTLNVLASGFAVAWVTKPYWRPKPAATAWSQSPVPPPAPAKTTEECWADFERAGGHEEAMQALASIPAVDERQARLRDYVVAYRQAPASVATPTGGSPLARAARDAAALAFWADQIEAGSEDWVWLQSVALDRSRSPLEREVALKGVVLAGQRRHKTAPEDNSGGWREQLAAFLLEKDFGRGTGAQGLALQAAAFALSEKLAPISRETLVARLGLLLLPQNGAAESVVLAAVDVGQQLAALELLGPVRAVARRPVSDACQQAALQFLGNWGDAEDLAWLESGVAANSTLQLAADRARRALTKRLSASASSGDANVVTTAPSR